MKMLAVKDIQRIVAISLFIGCGSFGASASQAADNADLKEVWDDYNAPEHLLRNYEAKFDGLPLSGTSTKVPWPDSYWPSNKGGVAYRWRTGETAWNARLYSYAELTRASQALIASLSPAEKFDLLRSEYDYPLTRSEKNRTKPDNPGWYGLCHGWAAAAISFKEPSPITMRNRHGLSIPFGSSDIKALLTYAHQDRQVSGHTDFLGLRCEQNEPTDTPQCKGVNAGSFHIILANKLGLGNQPFIMDMSRNYQVWNQPVYGYAAEIVDANAPLYATAAPGTTRVVKMRTKVHYLVEQGPNWYAIGTQNVGQFASRTYNYTLELNSAGKIIGGEWSDTRRPDFLWAQSAPRLTGTYSDLNLLYGYATAGATDGDEPIYDDDGGTPDDGDAPIDNGEGNYGPAGYCAVAVSCVSVGRQNVLYTDAYDGTHCGAGYNCPAPDNTPILGAWGSCQRSGSRQVIHRSCR